MLKAKVEILEKEIEECLNILEYQKIEQQIALELNDRESLEEIGHTIINIQKRLPILRRLLEEEKNPLSKRPFVDFSAVIEIKKSFV